MRLTMKAVGTAMFFMFLFLLGSPELAQAAVGGKITGTVKDQTNAVIPGATVTALNTATGVKQSKLPEGSPLLDKSGDRVFANGPAISRRGQWRLPDHESSQRVCVDAPRRLLSAPQCER